MGPWALGRTSPPADVLATVREMRKSQRETKSSIKLGGQCFIYLIHEIYEVHRIHPCYREVLLSLSLSPQCLTCRDRDDSRIALRGHADEEAAPKDEVPPWNCSQQRGQTCKGWSGDHGETWDR